MNRVTTNSHIPTDKTSLVSGAAATGVCVGDWVTGARVGRKVGAAVGTGEMVGRWVGDGVGGM